MRKGMSFAEAGRLGARKSRKRTQEKKQERVTAYNTEPRKCENCNDAIPYEKRKNKYCGHSCSASVNNQGVSRNYKTGQGVEKPCLNCGERTLNAKYCSSSCQGKFQWERRKEEIECTGVAQPVRTAKRYLLEKNGHKCETCGRAKWNGQSIPIVLDHISGNAEDWHLTNLRLLCCNCDAQTDTYKGKNKGNGRHWRRQSTKKGKAIENQSRIEKSGHRRSGRGILLRR